MVTRGTVLKSSRVLVFSDFNCPFCFTLNEWLEAEGLGSMVRWVGIEHRPDLPAGGANDGKDAELMHWGIEVQLRPEIGSPSPLWSTPRRAHCSRMPSKTITRTWRPA